MRKIRNVENVTYDKRLIEMTLFSLERDIAVVCHVMGINLYPFQQKTCSALKQTKEKNFLLKEQVHGSAKEVVGSPSQEFPKRVGTSVCHE